MKRIYIFLYLCILTAVLAGCFQTYGETKPSTRPQSSNPPFTKPTLESLSPETEDILPSDAPWQDADVCAEDIILYFNEVCLDTEYATGEGDPSRVQKWMIPIYYTVEGTPTDRDIAVLESFVSWINTVEGFPGMQPAPMPEQYNLRICFTDQESMIAIMGENYEYSDGAVTYWYTDDRIHDSTICVRNDLEQSLRDSVLLEELYNGTGISQDTALRTDSIIYQNASDNLWLSPMDELLLKLLYHPDIEPGMNAEECAAVIKKLYP